MGLVYTCNVLMLVLRCKCVDMIIYHRGVWLLLQHMDTIDCIINALYGSMFPDDTLLHTFRYVQ
jgi:hypothetical protein